MVKGVKNFSAVIHGNNLVVTLVPTREWPFKLVINVTYGCYQWHPVCTGLKQNPFKSRKNYAFKLASKRNFCFLLLLFIIGTKPHRHPPPTKINPRVTNKDLYDCVYSNQKPQIGGPIN